MGAFQRERRAPPSYARLLAAYDTHVFYRAEESTRRPPTDGGIRLINISVDSGPDSCRDEKLAKFRVTEGRKEEEDGNGVRLTEVWKQFLGIN